MPTTAPQISANQSNAALSTGPRSAEGKQFVSRNAEKHGLTSERFVLNSEEQTKYDALLTRLLGIYKPVDDSERDLVIAVAQNQWRLQRCRRTEAAFLDRCVRELTEADPSLSPDDAIAAIFTEPAYMAKMRLFLRYQTSIERAYAKACRELDAAILARFEAEAAELERLASTA